MLVILVLEFPLELRERIFDSFLTGTSEGTGLGLTISKRILRAHDGDLELVESEKKEQPSS